MQGGRACVQSNGCSSSGRSEMPSRSNTSCRTCPPKPRSTIWWPRRTCAGASSGDYQDLKQELGLGHYEGRGWRGFHHHASLSIAAYGFLVSERLAAGRSGGSKRNFIERQVPAVPANYIPRGSPARTAPRTRLHRDATPATQRSTHPAPRLVSALRASRRKQALVKQ